MYTDIFINGQYYNRTENETLKNLDYIYQDYYRDIFWNKFEEKLLNKLWLFCD